MADDGALDSTARQRLVLPRRASGDEPTAQDQQGAGSVLTDLGAGAVAGEPGPSALEDAGAEGPPALPVPPVAGPAHGAMPVRERVHFRTPEELAAEAGAVSPDGPSGGEVWVSAAEADQDRVALSERPEPGTPD